MHYELASSPSPADSGRALCTQSDPHADSVLILADRCVFVNLPGEMVAWRLRRLREIRSRWGDGVVSVDTHADRTFTVGFRPTAAHVNTRRSGHGSDAEPVSEHRILQTDSEAGVADTALRSAVDPSDSSSRARQLRRAAGPTTRATERSWVVEPARRDGLPSSRFAVPLWPVAGLWCCIVAAFLLVMERAMRISDGACHYVRRFRCPGWSTKGGARQRRTGPSSHFL